MVEPGAGRKMKCALIRVVFCVLRRALAGCAKCDERTRAEVAAWPEGTVVELKIFGAKPVMRMIKQGDRLKKLRDSSPPADLSIAFKSTEAAFKICTGRLGIWQAYAQKRFMLAGDIYFAMSVVRCMDTAENYLFPAFISRKLIRKRHKKTVGSLRIYAAVVFGA